MLKAALKNPVQITIGMIHTDLNACVGAMLALLSVLSRNIGHDEAFILKPVNGMIKLCYNAIY